MSIRSRIATMKATVPWWLKILIKIVITRLPVTHQLWKRFALLEHGAMDRPDYALSLVRFHYEKAMAVRPLPERFTALELGPGDSIFGGMAAAALGAERIYLVDSGDFISSDVTGCRRMAEHLLAQGLPIATASPPASVQNVMGQCGIHYLTEGLRSLRALPDAQVDFVWSQAVLEHIRKSEFLATLHELRRILAPAGVASHRVDLKDHLAGSLNNLRFSSRLWESDFMARSGFYTNRIGFSEMIEMFRQAKFSIISVEERRWDTVPLSLRKLHSEFRTRAEEDLHVSGFDVVLGPA